jgi:hypothetical protein
MSLFCVLPWGPHAPTMQCAYPMDLASRFLAIREHANIRTILGSAAFMQSACVIKLSCSSFFVFVRLSQQILRTRQSHLASMVRKDHF